MKKGMIGVCFTAAIAGAGCSESFKPSETDTGQDVEPDTHHDTATDPGSDFAIDPEPDPVVDTGSDVPVDPVVDIDPDSIVGPCTSDTDCMVGLNCCENRCVNLRYDPDHCSACGLACSPGARFCDDGMCTFPPCDSGTACTGITFCCGNDCCLLAGEVCCVVEGPGPVGGPGCHAGFCPGGCPECD